MPTCSSPQILMACSTCAIRSFVNAVSTACMKCHDVENGTMRRVDVRLAKHAAALAEGERMAGYDDTTRTLYLPLGADLPGLYGRAAVLCSGLLPSEDERQRVTRYHDVPQEIAEHLAALLAGRPEGVR